jgi:hypothetical protein
MVLTFPVPPTYFFLSKFVNDPGMLKNVKVSKQLAHRYFVTWIDFHRLGPKGHPSQEFRFKYVTI